MDLLVRLPKDAKGAAIIDYQAKESLYVIELFSRSFDNYYLSFIELREQELLRYGNYTDTLIVTVLYERHLNNLFYALKRFKKKYVRKPGKQQQKLVDILSSGSLGKIVTTTLIKAYCHEQAQGIEAGRGIL